VDDSDVSEDVHDELDARELGGEWAGGDGITVDGESVGTDPSRACWVGVK